MKTAMNPRRVFSLLLASMLAASLVLALPVQAQSESRISNNSAPQHMGLKDFFPEGA